MYKALLFDFYGVFHPDPLQAWLNQYQQPKDAWAMDLARQLDVANINFAGFIGRLASRYNLPVEQVHQEMVSSRDINVELVEFIKIKRDRFKTGLLSNAHSDEIGPVLRNQDLLALFDHVTISSELGIAKPDQAIFHHALNGLKSTPDQTIFVDDTLPNVVAARELGVTALLFQDNEQLFNDLEVLCAE